MMYCLRPRMPCFSFYFCLTFILTFLVDINHSAKSDESDPHREPSLCEVCKTLTSELMERLDETGKTHEVIETGHGLDTKKKRKAYRKSELRLIEAVSDPHVCEKILEYNVHAERKGSLRFAKGRSETMNTLQGLVDKGVKVELGIPHELWHVPSAGVTELQRHCYKIVEDYEDEIENWYFHYQNKDLTEYLCKGLVLRKNDQECLSEVWTGKEKVYDDDDENEEKKGEKGSEKPPQEKKGNKKKSKSKGVKGEKGSDGKQSKTKTNDEL